MNKNPNKHLIDEEEIEAISRVLKSGKLFRYGQDLGASECDQFEKEFTSFLGSESSFVLNSGTNALVVALMALGISEGDEVIIPSYTFVATAGAVLQVGAIPVVANINDSLMIDISDIESKITDRTKAIIPVHMDGLQCEIDRIVELGKVKNIPIVEDVAQALGAQFKGRPLGSWGDIGCFSFNRDKVLTAGEGGLITTNKGDLTPRIQMCVDQAINFNPTYNEVLEGTEPILGISTRVSELTGAMLRVQLSKLEKILKENRDRKSIYIKTLKDLPKDVSLIQAIDSEEAGTCLHLRFSDPLKASMMTKELMKLGLPFLPVTMRRAHCVWKWSKILGQGKSFSPKRDPYLNNDKNYNYSKINFIESINILSSILYLNIDITKSLEEVSEDAVKLLNCINRVCHEA